MVAIIIAALVANTIIGFKVLRFVWTRDSDAGIEEVAVFMFIALLQAWPIIWLIEGMPTRGDGGPVVALINLIKLRVRSLMEPLTRPKGY